MLNICTQTNTHAANTCTRREEDSYVKSEKSTHVIRSSLNLLVQFVLVLVPEGRVAHQQDVKDHTYMTRTQNLCERTVYETVGAVFTQTRSNLTDHMPICPLAFHTGPFSTPLETDILEFLQNL